MLLADGAGYAGQRATRTGAVAPGRAGFAPGGAVRLFAVLAVGAAAASAVSEDRQEATQPTSCVFDFGVRDNIGSVTNRFVLRNDGKESLRIVDVRATCACAAVLPKRAAVAPGGATWVDCVLDLRGLTGRVDKIFWVRVATGGRGEGEARGGMPSVLARSCEETDAGVGDVGPGATIVSVVDTDTVTLRMVGEARERIGFHPSWVVFDPVRRGAEELCATVRVGGYVMSAVVTGVAAPGTGGVFRAAIGADGRSVVVTVSAGLGDGLYQDTWTFATSDPKTPTLSLSVHARVRGSLWAVPSKFYFAGGAEPQARVVFVRSARGAAPYRVESAATEPPFGEATVIACADGNWQVALRNVVPDQLPDDAVLVVRTTRRDCPELRVPVVRLRAGSE